MSSLPTETAKEPLLFKTEKAYLVSFVNVCSQKKKSCFRKAATNTSQSKY